MPNIALALDRMKQLASLLRPVTATILSPITTPDTAGGETVTWHAIAVTTARITPIKANAESEVVISSRQQDAKRFLISLSHEVPISVSNRIVIGNTQYDIEGVITPYSYMVESQCVVVVSPDRVEWH